MRKSTRKNRIDRGSWDFDLNLHHLELYKIPCYHDKVRWSCVLLANVSWHICMYFNTNWISMHIFKLEIQVEISYFSVPEWEGSMTAFAISGIRSPWFASLGRLFRQSHLLQPHLFPPSYTHLFVHLNDQSINSFVDLIVQNYIIINQIDVPNPIKP